MKPNPTDLTLTFNVQNQTDLDLSDLTLEDVSVKTFYKDLTLHINRLTSQLQDDYQEQLGQDETMQVALALETVK